MNDLAFVINKVLEAVSAIDFATKYQELLNLLNQLQTQPSSDLEAQIGNSKNAVIYAHKEISSEDWSFARKNIFKQLACEELLGPGGINFINRTFSKNTATNSQTITQELQQRKDEIGKLITNLGQIKTALGGLGEYKSMTLPQGNVYMEIVFDKEVAIKSVDQLQKQADEWVKVFTSYRRLFSESIGEIEVVYINKVNPAIWGLSIPVILAQVFEKTISPLLRVRQEWLKGQILAEKLKGLKFQNYILRRNWEKGRDKLEQEAIEDITNKIVKQHKKSLPQGSSVNEVTGFVKYNTGFIFDFIKGGGSIDITASKDGDFTAKLKLSSTYSKIYVLEEKAKNLLEAPKLEAKSKTPKKLQDEPSKN